MRECWVCTLYNVHHKIDRVLGFFSSRPNLDPPPPHPSPADKCIPSPLIPGGDTHARGRGDGGPNSDEGTDTVVL